MQSKTIYDLTTLVYIKVVDKQKANDVEWRSYSKSFWGGVEEEGFYMPYGFAAMKKEQLESGKNPMETIFIVEEKKVYYRPYVKLKFSDGSVIIKQHFSTYEDACEWAKPLEEKMKIPYEF